MTTIAYDGVAVVTDSRQCLGDMILTDESVKGTRLPDGTIVATCGDATYFEPAVRFVAGGCSDKSILSNVEGAALVVDVNGAARVYYKDGTSCVVKPPFAMGSGERYAMAAMLSDKSAGQAVYIASKLDPYSGGPLQIFSVGIVEEV